VVLTNCNGCQKGQLLARLLEPFRASSLSLSNPPPVALEPLIARPNHKVKRGASTCSPATGGGEQITKSKAFTNETRRYAASK